ncbi:MAG: carboxymuconolactone decarboxylase family protein [Alphaproteobacteria bacterium]|jgi:alkylhydroperoxidase family enzyme|nr:carboxymuconolactone decarboxylase family protein [Alphaproteobacteria bacterium]
MPRIPYTNPDDPGLEADAAALLGKMQPLNVLKIMAYGGNSFAAYTRMATALLYKSKIDPILREMAIVRVGHLCRSPYEVHQHERISRDIGMAEDKLQALKVGPDDGAFDEVERAVLRLTDEIVHNVKASDATFAAARAHLGNQELVELVLAVGFYVMTSCFLENFEIEIEPPEVEKQIYMAVKGGNKST